MTSEGTWGGNQHSSLKLLQAISHFKKRQAEKSQLEHKLTILQQKCQATCRKTKALQNHAEKIDRIQRDYQQHNQSLQEVLQDSAREHATKIKKQKTLRQQSKENMGLIRELIVREKHEDYKRVKEKSQLNQLRITQQFKQSLHSKRQKSLEVKLQEENCKLSRTLFLQKKRNLAQSRAEQELVPLEKANHLTSQYLRQMRALEKEMVQELEQRKQSLRNSKYKCPKSECR